MSPSFRASAWQKLTLTWLAFLAATALSGCGLGQLARGEIKPPHVTLLGVTLTLPHAGVWKITCTLGLKNPNPEDLRVLGYDYELWLEGRSVAAGASQEEVTLPALGQTVVQVPIFLKLPALMKLVPSLLTPEKKIPYQVAGGVRLGSVLMGVRAPFRFAGEITPEESLNFLRSHGR
jgi:LEA14-like dessication related protein